jgi:uncharacterized delta-60 repeat protein
VAGFAAGASSDFVVARFRPDGRLDAGFGTGGAVRTDFFRGEDIANSVVIQSDGKIVAAGSMSTKDGAVNFGLTRYNANGSLDPTFGVGGRVTTDIDPLPEAIDDVIVQADGKLVVTGTSNLQFIVARYDANGGIDATFGAGGVVRRDFSTPSVPRTATFARSVAIQDDGRIVAAGQVVNLNDGSADFALARLEGSN